MLRKEGGGACPPRPTSQNREIIIPGSRRPTQQITSLRLCKRTNERLSRDPIPRKRRIPQPTPALFLPLFLAASPIEMTSRALFAPSSVRSPIFLLHRRRRPRALRVGYETGPLFTPLPYCGMGRCLLSFGMQNANFGCSSCNSLHFQIFDSFTLEFNSLHLPPPNPRLIETSSSPPPLDGTRN